MRLTATNEINAKPPFLQYWLFTWSLISDFPPTANALSSRFHRNCIYLHTLNIPNCSTELVHLTYHSFSAFAEAGVPGPYPDACLSQSIPSTNRKKYSHAPPPSPPPETYATRESDHLHFNSNNIGVASRPPSSQLRNDSAVTDQPPPLPLPQNRKLACFKFYLIISTNGIKLLTSCVSWLSRKFFPLFPSAIVVPRGHRDLEMDKSQIVSDCPIKGKVNSEEGRGEGDGFIYGPARHAVTNYKCTRGHKWTDTWFDGGGRIGLGQPTFVSLIPREHLFTWWFLF